MSPTKNQDSMCKSLDNYTKADLLDANTHGGLGHDNEASQHASAKFLAGFNCAQAVLYASCDRLQLDRDLALRLATGFGAGLAREGEVCGAVSGGILAISLRYGRGESEDRSKTEQTYAKTREFVARFKERHRSVICRELIKCDLRTDEGQKFFKENDLLHKICIGCVETASALASKAIQVDPQDSW